MRRSGFIRKKPGNPEKAKENYEAMWAVYNNIWKKRRHVSAISGAPLGGIPKSWMFDHLLDESTHPHLKHEEKNIILITFEEHEVKSLGHPLPKHKELIEEAKKLFSEGS